MRSKRNIAINRVNPKRRLYRAFAEKHSNVITYLYDSELSEIEIMIKSAEKLVYKK